MPSVWRYDAYVIRNKKLKEVLASNLKAAMEAKGMTQQNVAKLAGQRGHDIDQTTVGRIARADIPTTVDKLDALAAALGLEPWHLLVQDLDPREPPILIRPESGPKRVREVHRLDAAPVHSFRPKKVTK